VKGGGWSEEQTLSNRERKPWGDQKKVVTDKYSLRVDDRGDGNAVRQKIGKERDGEARGDNEKGIKIRTNQAEILEKGQSKKKERIWGELEAKTDNKNIATKRGEEGEGKFCAANAAV